LAQVRLHPLAQDTLSTSSFLAMQPKAPTIGGGQRQPASSQVSKSSSIDDLLFKSSVDMELFRGAPLADVLKRWCQVFDNQECKGEYWGPSEQVDHVDIFISHNWAVSRRSKFLVLAMTFNAWPSMAIAMVSSSCCFCLVIAGVLPTIEVTPAQLHTTFASCWCLPVHLITFCMALVSFDDVAHFLGYRGPKCFVDKMCVNQKDADKKKRAIACLGSFVYYSREFLVIYTDVYLTRLWTMYEIATFMILNRGGQAKLISVSLMVVLVASIGAVSCQFLAISVLGISSLSHRAHATFLLRAERWVHL